MKVALVRATFGQQREVGKTEAKHLWYDQDAEWLISVTAGRLVFSSDKNGKTKVTTADATKTTYTTRNDYDKIMKWFSLNSGDFGLEIVEAGSGVVAFAFADELQDDIEDALAYNRFDYEIL